MAVDKFSECKKYAIKTISTLDEEEEKNIKNEIKIWDKIQKEGNLKSIPNYYGFSREEIPTQTQTQTDFHLIFDFYPSSLSQVIKDMKTETTPRPFPLNKLIQFTRTLIHTMAYLQTEKVCHRDLKPANLMVDDDCDRVFVIDFGAAKEMQHYDATTLTRIIGTEPYLSPEMYILLKEQSDNSLEKMDFFRSDVFSLGLILLELGVLSLPERSNDESVYRNNISNKIQQFIKTYKEIAEKHGLAKQLEGLCMVLKCCLRIKASERPDFIGLFLHMIEIFERENEQKIRQLILVNDNY